MAWKKVCKTLSSVVIWLGSLFLSVSCVLFALFAPLKTEVFGLSLSFSTLDNPLRIALVLFLLGFGFKSASRRPVGLRRQELASLVFCAVLLVHISSPVMTSLDSRWSVPTAKSLTKEGNANLDEYEASIAPDDYRVEKRGGHLYTIFPIGPSLLAMPVALISNDEVIAKSHMDVERLVSSLLIALSTVFLFFICLSALGSRTYALFMVFIFAFCTPAWSTATRALWQHGPSIFLLSASLFIVTKARDGRPALIQFLGLPLVFSYVARPTNIIPLALFSLFVLFRFRKYFIRYLLWSFPVLVPFLLYNLSVYQALLSPYYIPGRLGSHPHFFEALAANLICPARGLFVYSPVFLLAFLGVFLKIKCRRIESLDFVLWGIVCLHWLAISSFPHWWAGHSYGPRFFSDMTPFFLCFLIPVMEEIQNRPRKKWLPFILPLAVLTAISFFIHFRGAVSTEVFDWNSTPVDVELKPERVWDWNDIQFLRGIG